MALAVEVADSVSAAWRRRFLGHSAALGEEAITSSILLALEEELSPSVSRVKSFTRAEEGGTHGPATGADFEIHFIASGGARHLGYRVQAKLAKREYSPPTYTYDLGYRVRRGVRQVDALIASARSASCIPLYFVYNSPSCVGEILAHRHFPEFYRRWQGSGGCLHQHVLSAEAALTISTVPARLARQSSKRSSRKLTNATDVSCWMTPWSCLLHQHPVEPMIGIADGSSQLAIADLRKNILRQVDWTARFPYVADEDLDGLESERNLIEEQTGQDNPVPEDVGRLWEGEANFSLDDLVRQRTDAGSDADEARGDESLRSMLIVELQS